METGGELLGKAGPSKGLEEKKRKKNSQDCSTLLAVWTREVPFVSDLGPGLTEDSEN